MRYEVDDAHGLISGAHRLPELGKETLQDFIEFGGHFHHRGMSAFVYEV